MLATALLLSASATEGSKRTVRDRDRDYEIQGEIILENITFIVPGNDMHNLREKNSNCFA